ncbi:unnamed protein product, partial [Amoebophrya sp. A120]
RLFGGSQCSSIGRRNFHRNTNKQMVPPASVCIIRSSPHVKLPICRQWRGEGSLFYFS